jgi:hypothetical protein
MTPTTNNPTRVTAALAYAAAGWPVLPLHTPARDGECSCQTAGCARAGKHPRSRRGLTDATTSSARITAWWRRWPDANIAIRTGRLVVLDLDGPDGQHALAELEASHEPLPTTRRARTARGQHIYLDAGDTEITSSAGQLARGFDVRGHGGFIVAPPSRHATGHRYTWTHTGPVAPLPTWLAKLLTANRPSTPRAPLPPAVATGTDGRAQRYVDAALAAELAAITTAPTGTRNQTLNRAAFRLGQLAGAGLTTPDALTPYLLHAARSVGLGEPEALATIASGITAGRRHPRRRPIPARR